MTSRGASTAKSHQLSLRAKKQLGTRPGNVCRILNQRQKLNVAHGRLYYDSEKKTKKKRGGEREMSHDGSEAK